MTKEKSFKPMLATATPAEGFQYRFPLLISPKLDGIRAIVRGGVVLSRSLKPIPNKYVQSLYGHAFYEGWDGELIVGEPNAPDCMQATTKGVMRIEGTPAVTFFVFDWHDNGAAVFTWPFKDRLAHLATLIARGNKVFLVPQHPIGCQAQMDSFEAEALARGYEGAMLRDPNGLYKYGRSTAKEGGLIKIKRFAQSEAQVVDFEERMHNANEATVDELGHTKRSTHQENLVGRGDLGALVCHTKEGVVFNIGTGLSDQQRAEFWGQRPALLGKIVTYKHFEAAGVKVAPRFPVFVAFRDEIDL